MSSAAMDWTSELVYMPTVHWPPVTGMSAISNWEYRVTWTQYGAGRLGDESKQDFEDFYNELGKEGWEYCGNAGTRDTMQYEQGWALNLWKRPR